MKHDWDRIHDMYLFGFTFGEIAKKLGLAEKSRGSIQRGLKVRGYSKRKPGYKDILCAVQRAFLQELGSF